MRGPTSHLLSFIDDGVHGPPAPDFRCTRRHVLGGRPQRVRGRRLEHNRSRHELARGDDKQGHDEYYFRLLDRQDVLGRLHHGQLRQGQVRACCPGGQDPGPPVPKGGDNSIQSFGNEADSQQTAEVVAALRGFYKAQAAEDWKTMCADLGSGVQDTFQQLAQQASAAGQDVGDGGCESLLSASHRQIPKKQLKQLANFKVGSVRVKGKRGFVIYKAGDWFAIPMVSEDQGWKVGSLGPVPIQ